MYVTAVISNGGSLTLQGEATPIEPLPVLLSTVHRLATEHPAPVSGDWSTGIADNSSGALQVWQLGEGGGGQVCVTKPGQSRLPSLLKAWSVGWMLVSLGEIGLTTL